MTPMEMSDALYEANIRLDNMWLFPAWNGGESLAEALELFADDSKDLPGPIADLVKDWSEDHLDELFSGRDSEDFHEAMDNLSADAHRRNIAGFLGVFSTPVQTFTSATSSHYSWGHTWHKLLFGDTLESLTAVAVAWKDECLERDKQRTWDDREDV